MCSRSIRTRIRYDCACSWCSVARDWLQRKYDCRGLAVLQVWDVAYNPSGTHLCSVGDDSVVQLYTAQ